MAYEKQSDKIELLQQNLTEMQGAIRRLAEENSVNLKLLGELRATVDGLRQELQRLKASVESTKGMYDNMVQRYE